MKRVVTMSIDGNQKVVQRWDDQKLWGIPFHLIRQDSNGHITVDSNSITPAASGYGQALIPSQVPEKSPASASPAPASNADTITRLYGGVVTQLCADCKRDITGALRHNCSPQPEPVYYVGPKFMSGEGS